MVRTKRFIIISAATALLTSAIPAIAQSNHAGVTDLTSANAEAIEAADLIEALAVPRGTHISTSAPPTVRLPIYFELNSAELRSDAVKLLENLSDALKASDLETFSFAVEGHTDSLGTEEHNDRLSSERAGRVKEFLIARGVQSGRLDAVGRGEEHPVAPNAIATGRQRNRRVEIINRGAKTRQ